MRPSCFQVRPKVVPLPTRVSLYRGICVVHRVFTDPSSNRSPRMLVAQELTLPPSILSLKPIFMPSGAPGRMKSLSGNAKGRGCEPTEVRLSGPLRDHRAPIQRGAHPVTGQDRRHPKTASRTNRALTIQDRKSQEGRKQAKQTPARLPSASSEAEALGSSRTPFATTGSGAQSRPGSPVLRLEEAVPRPVSSGRERIPIARRVEAGMEGGAVQPILRPRFEGRDRRVPGLRGHA